MTMDKILWTEGTLLGPQHFQLFERNLHRQTLSLQKETNPFAYGVINLVFDEYALAESVIKLIDGAIVLPNGYITNIKNGNNLEAAIPESDDNPYLYLLVAKNNFAEGITGYPKHDNCGWVSEYVEVADIHDEERKREVLVARPNLKLAFGQNDTDFAGFYQIKIAKIIKLPLQNTVKLCHKFIPPIINISCSLVMQRMLDNLLLKIKQQIACLDKLKIEHKGNKNQFSYSDFVYLDLTKVLSKYYLTFQFLRNIKSTTPLDIYRELVGLLGILLGYLSELENECLPQYNHEALQDTFTDVNNLLDKLLVEVIPTNNINIDLDKIAEGTYSSTLLKESMLIEKSFCVALSGDYLDEQNILKVCSQLKVSSPQKINLIVNSFIDGVNLTYMENPHSYLKAKHKYHYLLLDKSSPHWQEILSAKQISIFVANDFRKYNFELIAF